MIQDAVAGFRPLPISPCQMAGFQAVCRQGRLGTVVDHVEAGRPASRGEILVRGESTGRCFYHVPLSAIRSVSPRRMEVLVGLLASDFVPREDGDGSIELFVPEPRSRDD